VLVAEALLRQTFARKVVPAYKEVMRRWPTPSALAVADEADVRTLIVPLGFSYRAAELILIAQDICARLGGRVPDTMQGLLSLKGVGDYTASAILAFSFGKREPIVDRNVVRLLKRVYGLPQPLHKLQPNPGLRRLAASLLPRNDARTFNYALLDFAALVCTHYRPKCPECPVWRQCLTPGAL
jgi:A/G-specific adenine glycosylase